MTLWTIACQAPLSMGFSRQEYWSGWPCPPPGDLPQGSIPHLLHCRLSSLRLSHRASPTLHVHMTYIHNTYLHTHIYIPMYIQPSIHTCTYTTHTRQAHLSTTHVYDTSVQTQQANDQGSGAKHYQLANLGKRCPLFSFTDSL